MITHSGQRCNFRYINNFGFYWFLERKAPAISDKGFNKVIIT